MREAVGLFGVIVHLISCDDREIPTQLPAAADTTLNVVLRTTHPLFHTYSARVVGFVFLLLCCCCRPFRVVACRVWGACEQRDGLSKLVTYLILVRMFGVLCPPNNTIGYIGDIIGQHQLL